MEIVSTVFDDGDNIPFRYTCDGLNINPPLTFNNVPAQTACLALIVEDVDSPEIFYHWVLWNIDPKTDEIDEDQCPEGATQGLNSKELNGYSGPCPETGTHRYYFKLFALGSGLDIPESTTGEELEEAIEGLILDYTELMVFYGRQTF